jgi:hypothetical protein
MDTGKLYEVVRPLGKATLKKVVPAEPLAGLDGKKIGFVWTIFTNGDLLVDVLADALQKRYKNLKTVKLMPGKAAKWGDYPDESIREVVRDAGVDAVIVTIGC